MHMNSYFLVILFFILNSCLLVEAGKMLDCDDSSAGDQTKKKKGNKAASSSRAVVTKCDFCKKECTGAWNESYTIWRRTCCLGMSRAPSGSSSVGPLAEATEVAKDPPPPPADHSQKRKNNPQPPPACIMKTVMDLRILNPNARDVRPVPFEFGIDGWAVAGPGGALVLPPPDEVAAYEAAAAAAPLP